MSSRDPHGDDWIEVLGGLLIGLISFAWSLIMLSVRLVQWAVRQFRR
jgi:hypothetical protein